MLQKLDVEHSERVDDPEDGAIRPERGKADDPAPPSVRHAVLARGLREPVRLILAQAAGSLGALARHGRSRMSADLARCSACVGQATCNEQTHGIWSASAGAYHL